MGKWEYQHEFVEAQRLEGTGQHAGLFGGGPEKMRNVYAWEEINQRLNELGREGWELINAEPHWIWSTMTYGAPLWARMLNDSRRRVEATSAYPENIAGWYCIFRRELQENSLPLPPTNLTKAQNDSGQLDDSEQLAPPWPIDPALGTVMNAVMASQGKDAIEDITVEVKRLAESGYGIPIIASRLGISESEVNARLRRK